jgi:hypothetical protein
MATLSTTRPRLNLGLKDTADRKKRQNNKKKPPVEAGGWEDI